MSLATIVHRILKMQQFGNSIIGATSLIRYKSDKFKNTSDLCSSTILIQDGVNVQELPVVVRKVNDVFAYYNNIFESSSNYTTTFTNAENEIHEMIHKEFSQCSSLEDVMCLLSKCSTVTPNIALGAVERIYNLLELKIKTNNDPDSTYIGALSSTEILNKLFDVIIRNEDIYGLLRAVKFINLRNDQHLSIVSDEILKRVTDNKLSIHQLCDVVSVFGINKHVEVLNDAIEKLWIGFIEREKEFDEKNIVECFKILHYLQDSRKMLLGLLEKRVLTTWWQMKTNSVIEILDALCKNNVNVSRLFPVLGRWMNTNIHVISEDELLQLISKFSKLKYVDAQIEKSLERYVKAKGPKITSHILVVTILNYITLFRIRNLCILDSCTDYFIANANDLNPMLIKPFLYSLGHLNHKPGDGIKFWKEVDDLLEKHFSKINIEDIIEIMMSCIYLQKHPLNFVPKIFNQHFFEKSSRMQNAALIRNRLIFLDTALSLECSVYNGPILPKDLTSKSVWNDGRIKRLVNHIRDSFEIIAGGSDCLSTFVGVPQTFPMEFYVVDIMFHPKGLCNSLLYSSLKRDRNINTAVIINLPEHFCSNSNILVGPQEMRIRHLRILGLKVVTLKYEVLSRLKMHRRELEKYIISRMKEAQDAC